MAHELAKTQAAGQGLATANANANAQIGAKFGIADIVAAIPSWTDNSTNEDGFKAEQSTTTGTAFAQVAQVAAGVTTYAATGLGAATPYFFRVRAHNLAGGNSAYTAEANATTQAAVAGLPAAPSGVTATAGNAQVTITWTADRRLRLRSDETLLARLAASGVVG